MLVSEDNILELIPQRPPMVMVDELVLCNEKQVISHFTIQADNIFMDRNGFTAPGMMEVMAQTAAARNGYLMKNQANGANKKVPIGVIGSIKNFKQFFQPCSDSKLITTLDIAYELMNVTRVTAKVELDGQLVAKGELQIYITEQNLNK